MGICNIQINSVVNMGDDSDGKCGGGDGGVDGAMAMEQELLFALIILQ